MSDVETKGLDRAAIAATAAVEKARNPVRPEVTRDETGSFGRALAAAREARGLSQSEVAAQLRLRPRQVKAIEQEDLASLPEGPFVRGYVRNFARLVDLPAEPLLSLLNAKLKPADPLRTEGEGAKAVSPIQRVPREPISGRLVIGGVVAMLIVLAAFGWWTMRADGQKAGIAAMEAAPAPTASPRSSAAPPATAAPEPAVAAALPAAPAETELRLSFRDVSWVEIRQADGTVLLSQTNAAGTVQTIEGVPPYTLVIGNASKVDLEFRGQPVDLSSSASRDDVARLRLE
jgi:cytoskeleton protein RodZ